MFPSFKTFMQAVILAGGLGTAMMPFTANIHKVLLPIGDKAILEHILDSLTQNEIKDIFIVVSNREEQIKRQIGNGQKFGARIEYLHQDNPKGGTADAVRCASGKVKGSFLLVNGDLFFHPSIIKSMLNSFKDCDGLIACKEVENPQDFGILKIENNLIKKIFEKVQNPPSKFANLGIYLLPEKIFEAIEKTPLSKRNEYELTDSIQILIDKGLKFKPFYLDEFWVGIERVPDYEKAKEIYEEWKKKR